MNFIIAHKEFAIALALLVISEAQALNPNWKYNGILDMILGFLNKAK
jgi:hypothetical protein